MTSILFKKKIGVLCVAFLICTLNVVAQSQQIYLIQNPDATGSYTGSPIIFNAKLYVTYVTTGPTTAHLGLYNGTSITIIANPDGGYGDLGSPVIYNNNLYFLYQNASNITQLARYDGTSVTLIPNPDATGNIALGLYAIYNNNLYLVYRDASGVQQLAQFNGSSMQLIPNPDGGLGYYSFPIVYNGNLYIQYSTASSQYQLAKFDGTSLTLIPNPDGGSGDQGTPIVFNNLLYFEYINGSGIGQMASYDGNSVTLIPNPDGAFPGINGTPAVVYDGDIYYHYASNFPSTLTFVQYDGSSGKTIPYADAGPYGYQAGIPFVYNNDIYFQYRNQDGAYEMVEYNGSNTTIVGNPNASSEGYWFATPVIYNGAMYVQYNSSTGISSLGKYDETPLTLFANPDSGNGYQGSAIVYNDTLFFEYENAKGINQLGYLGICGTSKVTIKTDSGDTVCENSTVKFSAITNPAIAASYDWQINGNDIGQTDSIYATKALTNGDMINCIVTPLSPTGCLSNAKVSSDTISMTVQQPPNTTITTTDSLLKEGDSSAITAMINGNYTNFSWSPVTGLSDPNSLNPIAAPTHTTTYWLYVSGTNGCTDTASINLFVLEGKLYMPSAFDPKGRNMLFRVPPSISIDLINFSVYDRWGTKIFQTSDIKNGWDGTFQGEDQPMNTYVWVVQYISDSGNIVTEKGNVLLLR